MKKCPFCKAEIEDTARFCLYCMKPLVGKDVIVPPPKRRKLWIPVVIVLVLCLSVVLVLSMTGEKTEYSPTTSTRNTTKPVRQDVAPAPEQPENGPVEDEPSGEQPENTPVEDAPATCEHSYTMTDSQEASCTVDGFTIYTCDKCGNRYRQPDSATGHSFVDATCQLPQTCSKCGFTQGDALGHTYADGVCSRCNELTPQQAKIVYTYRAANTYDDITIYYVNPETDIVITGVQIPSDDGVYRIPESIDGKRVVAIDKNAFSDTGSNARKIYLPTTLKAIWDNAFQGCPLTDIYFTHNTYIHGDAIPDSQGLLTIHCPQDCHNRFYYSFSDYAHTYGATWEEWNGL